VLSAVPAGTAAARKNTSDNNNDLSQHTSMHWTNGIKHKAHFFETA